MEEIENSFAPIECATHEFEEPKKKIMDPSHVDSFMQSNAYQELLGFTVLV
jgi:hypothetical protein